MGEWVDPFANRLIQSLVDSSSHQADPFGAWGRKAEWVRTGATAEWGRDMKVHALQGLEEHDEMENPFFTRGNVHYVNQMGPPLSPGFPRSE